MATGRKWSRKYRDFQTLKSEREGGREKSLTEGKIMEKWNDGIMERGCDWVAEQHMQQSRPLDLHFHPSTQAERETKD